MRRRAVRVFIFTLLLLGLALATLGFRELHVHIPGFPRVDRAGTGPLGLKLGLDLRGGGHLVYQADTDPRVEVTFAQPVEVAKIQGVLDGLKFADFSVLPRSDRTFTVKLAQRDTGRGQELRSALAEKVGAISSFQVKEQPSPTPEQMEGVLGIIKHRVNRFGLEEPIIQKFGDDRVIVQLPGAGGSRTEVVFKEAVNPENLRGALEGLGLEGFRVDQQSSRAFRIKTASLNQRERQELRDALAEKVGAIESLQTTAAIDEVKALIGQTARLEFKERTCTNPSCTTFTDEPISAPNLSGDDLTEAFAATDPTTGVQWAVNIRFDARGADIFSELTRRIHRQQDTKRIAILLDEQNLIAPVALAWIRDGRSQITGNFTREEARTLAIQLESGALPVSLKLVQESDVDALLGSDSLRQSLVAGLVGLGLVAVFMVAYYRMAGVVAALALVFYAVIVLALFKLIPVTLTLSGIAGFILSIGMAVDANVLIFERMKEEIRVGRTLASSMEVGFSRAWTAIRDSNITTFIACGILIWFGNRLGGELVTGFALTLFIGVAVSMFTALVVSRNLLQLLAWAGLGQRLNLFTPERIARPVPTPGGR